LEHFPVLLSGDQSQILNVNFTDIQGLWLVAKK
jgi:hypothetical protein